MKVNERSDNAYQKINWIELENGIGYTFRNNLFGFIYIGNPIPIWNWISIQNGIEVNSESSGFPTFSLRKSTRNSVPQFFPASVCATVQLLLFSNGPPSSSGTMRCQTRSITTEQRLGDLSPLQTPNSKLRTLQTPETPNSKLRTSAARNSRPCS